MFDVIIGDHIFLTGASQCLATTVYQACLKEQARRPLAQREKVSLVEREEEVMILPFKKN